MIINWPLIVVLFGLSIPGILIVMSRLVYFLLPDTSEPIKKKASRLVIFQALFTVLVMSFTGTVLSSKTGLSDPILVPLLQGKDVINTLLGSLLPILINALACFIVFCVLYYGVVHSILDKHSLEIMTNLRKALKLDGLLLYGIGEEIIARWGLVNLVAFFILLLTRQMNNVVIYTSIIVSALLFVIAQIPIYIAAGCQSDRRLAYSLVLLSMCQSVFFGLVFCFYGLTAAIITHVLFHLFWWYYDH